MKRLDRRDQMEDVFDQMQNMFKQFQEFGMDQLDIESQGVPVNIKEEEDQLVVTADMPGVQKENINLKADEDGIEISAESSHEMKEENEKYVRMERNSRQFSRRVNWPKEVDPESISAEYEDGVLTVRADKEEPEDWDVEIE